MGGALALHPLFLSQSSWLGALLFQNSVRTWIYSSITIAEYLFQYGYGGKLPHVNKALFLSQSNLIVERDSESQFILWTAPGTEQLCTAHYLGQIITLQSIPKGMNVQAVSIEGEC